MYATVSNIYLLFCQEEVRGSSGSVKLSFFAIVESSSFAIFKHYTELVRNTPGTRLSVRSSNRTNRVVHAWLQALLAVKGQNVLTAGFKVPLSLPILHEFSKT